MKRALQLAGAALIVVLLVLPGIGRAAAPTISTGPFTGQYYRYSSPSGWFVDQGKVTVGGAGYLQLWARDGWPTLRAVGFYGADTSDYQSPGLAGAGLSADVADNTTAAIAWAYDTGGPFKVRDNHGLILTIGFFLDIGGSHGTPALPAK